MKKVERKEPPIVFVKSNWDKEKRVLIYDYNGRNTIKISVPGNDDLQHRVLSDAQLQSQPMTEQIYLMLYGNDVTARVEFCLSEDSISMRPHRAKPEQAIVGQVGRPTIKGVNGVYDIFDDLMISWHGQPWRWIDSELKPDGKGNLTAAMEVTIGRKPWVIAVYPHYYREHLGFRYHTPWEVRPETKPVAGWCSWEAYGREVTEDKVVEVSDFIDKNFREYGLEYVQIDDGYQKTPINILKGQSLAQAWDTPSSHFPSGLKSICDKIKERGLKPGIWISASVWRPTDPNVVEEECFMKGEDGKPVDSRWIQRAIDCLPNTLKTQIIPLFQMLKERGFKYIKTDQIRHLLYDALQEMVRQDKMTNAEADKRFRKYMEATRKGMGNNVYYLASWGVLNQVVGVVDACRISCDANPKWMRIRMQLVEEARFWHTQRITFLNDPDHICARTKPEWAQSLLSHVSLTGGLFMLSDPVTSYDAQRVRMIQQTLPTLETYTGETGPLDMHYCAFPWTKEHGAAFKQGIVMEWDNPTDAQAMESAGDFDTMKDDHPFSSLWSFHLKTEAGKWCVAGRWATAPLRDSTIKVDAIGLESEKNYVAFDFWAQKYLGTVRNSFQVPALPLGNCQIIALREELDRPQFMASSRHVSMDAVSVKSQSWKDGTLDLDLEGIAGTTEKYFFHCPKGWSLLAAGGTGAEAVAENQTGECAAVTVTFKKKKAKITTRFKKA